MTETLDKELRAKYNAGVKHAQAKIAPMREHHSKSHANAYHKGYEYGSGDPVSTQQEHEHPYWSGKHL